MKDIYWACLRRETWVELIKDAGFESKTFKDQFGRETFYLKNLNKKEIGN